MNERFYPGDRVRYVGKTAINHPSTPNEKEDLVWGLEGVVIEANDSLLYGTVVQFDRHSTEFAWPVRNETIVKIPK